MAPYIVPIIFSALIFPGVFLVFVPFFPALSYMLVVSLAFALINGFSMLSLLQFGILTFITLVSLCVDFSAGALGSKYGGAHARSIGWGILGMLIGTLSFPPFGGILGLFAAIYLSERNNQNKTNSQSLKAAGGALLGTIAGIGINAFLAIIFFLCFITFVFL